MYLLQKKVLFERVNFRDWVSTVIHNIFLNNYKHIVRTHAMLDETENLYHLNLPQHSNFDITYGSYTISEITNAINSFTDEYRIPYSMYVSGYKYEEIAQRLNLPISIIKSRVFYTRHKMQTILVDYRL